MKSKAIKVIVASILGLATVGAISGYLFKKHEDYVAKLKKSSKSEVTVEYGSQITLDLFFDEVPEETRFITNVSQIDTSLIQSYEISISNHGYVTKSILNVVDTTPPTGEPIPQKIYKNQLPDPNKCVKNIEDLTDVKVDYAENVDASIGGERKFDVVLTDAYGNEGIVKVPFIVMDDHTAPIINGADAVVLKCIPDYAEEIEVDLMQGIIVTDDFDKSPTCVVDDKAVQYDTVGKYPLTYVLSDECGNFQEYTIDCYVVQSNYKKSPAPKGTPVRYIDIKITKKAKVKKKKKKGNNYIDVDIDNPSKGTADKAHQAARKILNKIITSNMTKEEKAFKIVQWVHKNIGYSHQNKKYHNWAQEALYAFKYRQGSCFATYACCKALFDVAGIPNRQVTRSPVTYAKHFWNLAYLNGGWYHCDATKWSGTGKYCFMMTDKEIAKARGNHRFKKANYPARSTKSVQKYLNYSNATIKKGMPKPTEKPSPTSTPTPTPKPTEVSSTTVAKPTAAPTSVPETTVAPTNTPKPTSTPKPVETENTEE